MSQSHRISHLDASHVSTHLTSRRISHLSAAHVSTHLTSRRISQPLPNPACSLQAVAAQATLSATKCSHSAHHTQTHRARCTPTPTQPSPLMRPSRFLDACSSSSTSRPTRPILVRPCAIHTSCLSAGPRALLQVHLRLPATISLTPRAASALRADRLRVHYPIESTSRRGPLGLADDTHSSVLLLPSLLLLLPYTIT